MDTEKLKTFIDKVFYLYNLNPYHNFSHAMHVMQQF